MEIQNVEIPNTLNKPEFVWFNGVKFSLVSKKRYYISTSTKNIERKYAIGLHVAIWEFYNKQKIPKGYCIHHKDHNTLNNFIDNLELVSITEHASNHAKEWAKNNKELVRDNLEKIRPLTKEWHASEEGKEWHKEHWNNSLGKIFIEKQFICEECNKEFARKTSRKTPYRFCSDNCQMRSYRRRNPEKIREINKRSSKKKSLQHNS